MANYTSKYTGAQIDFSVASGSSTSGNISSSAAGTGTFGNLKAMKSSSFGTSTPSKKLVTVKGDISASGDLYLGGNDLKSGTGTTRVTLGATTEFKGNISASGTGHISASGKIHSNDEFILKDGSPAGDTLARLYASSDDGILDIYQNNSIKNRINGNGISYIQGGNVAIGTDKAPKLLTIAGDISASGDYYSQTTVNFNQSISSSGDLYVGGSDIFAGTAGTKRLTFGARNAFVGHVSASGGITASGKLATNDEIWVKDTNLEGDTIARLYASSDDGILDIYQNNSVKTRLHGNGISYIQGGNVKIGTDNTTAPSSLTVFGNISASSGISSSGTITTEDLIVNDNATVAGDLDIADTIYHTGDSNTKIRFPSTDTISFHTSGNEQMVISSGGHITASQNISASGQLYGNIINLKTRVKAIGSSLEFAGDSLDFVDDGSTSYHMRLSGTGVNFPTGHITASGNISASGDVIAQSGSFGGAVPTSGKTLTVEGDISASGDVYLEGTKKIYTENDGNSYIQSDTADRIRFVVGGSQMLLLDEDEDRVNIGYGNKLAVGLGNNSTPTADVHVYGNVWVSGSSGHITASGDISSSGVITLANAVNFEGASATATRYTFNNLSDTTNGATGRKLGFNIATGSDVGGAVINMSGSGGNGFVGIGTKYTNQFDHALTVEGDISASGDMYIGGTFAKYRREVIGTKADGHNLNVSSSGAVILQSTNGATINLPAMSAANKGVQYTFVHNGTATHTWNLSPNSNDKIMGSCIDSNAIATVVEGASNGAGADNKDLQLDNGSGVGDRVTIVGDGSAGWYITECMGSFTFES